MTGRKRLNLSLNSANTKHNLIWEILNEYPVGQRTDRICDLIIMGQFVQGQGEIIREIIREELKNLKIQSNTEEIQAEEVSDDVLGFLRSL